MSPTQNIEEITAVELRQKLDDGADVQIIDVREQKEHDFASIAGAKLIPLGEVVKRIGEIDPARETIVHCKGGGRSAQAIQALKNAGFTGTLKNLKGGITAWSNDVDPSVAKY